MAESGAARAAQLAALAHRLVAQEHAWDGSPLTQDDLEQVALAAAGKFDQATLLDRIRETDAPGTLLLGVLAIVWAAGFKTGSMFSEESRT